MAVVDPTSSTHLAIDLTRSGGTSEQGPSTTTPPSLSPPVTPRRSPVPGSLLEQFAAGDATLALTFAGQGTPWWPTLDAVLRRRPWLLTAAERSSRLVRDLVGELGLDVLGATVWPFDPLAWRDGGPVPSDGARAGLPLAMPGVLLAQLLAYRELWEDGLHAAVAAGAVVAASGHSGGLLAAAAIAADPDASWADDPSAAGLRDVFGLALLIGHVAGSRPGALGDDAMDRALRGEACPEAVLASVAGMRIDRLADVVAGIDDVVIAHHHGPRRAVLAGPASALARARDELERRCGAGSPTPEVVWEPLPVSALVHHPSMIDAVEEVVERAARAGIELAPPAGGIAVVRPDGPAVLGDTGWGAAAVEQVAAALLTRPGHWDRTVQSLVDGSIGTVRVPWLLDIGPGVGVARLTAAAVRGTGAAALAAETPEDRNRLLLAGPRLAPTPAYASFAPRVVEHRGRTVPDNRFTRATGRAPVILAGMTPTTADAPIVAAAANAGFVAELAGGGQVSETIFERRLEELADLLDPGVEVVFNALYLDPYLWGLHLGQRRLVQAARRAGAPICGVTVSAGVPPVDEAVRLLDELASLGMWCNAFKPGTPEQIRQVVEIARQASEHTVFVHVEGAVAGGHHSWHDLEDLLLAGYHELRSLPNVVVCAGGGVARPARAAELLDGTWSIRHTGVVMPVDAVLIGTAAMACREATTAPGVKELLVATVGTRPGPLDDGRVLTGRVEGGVTSGRSGLNADIHFVDNDASRCARLLDEVAGDADEVRRRRDEIIAALARTAKPFFGDTASMTYAELLERFVELTALGTGSRYDDGVWLDRSHRERFIALLQRAEARLDPAESGTVPTAFADPASVDDPAVAIADLCRRYPAARTTRLHPADPGYFLSVCRRPGKPVPFVPVIDADVRRWYQSDALWQAHHPAYDASSVLVIPGPVSVAGIESRDEPVADLLGRFEAGIVAGRAALERTDRRRRNRRTQARTGAAAIVLEAPTVLLGDRIVPNPVRRLGPPDRWDADPTAPEPTCFVLTRSADDDDRDGAEGARLVTLGERRAELRLTLPGIVRPVDEVVLHFEVFDAAGDVAVAVDAAHRADEAQRLARRVLLAGAADDEQPAALGEAVRCAVEAPAGTDARRARDAFARVVGGEVAPPDAWVQAAWPAIFRALTAPELVPWLLDLLHLRHQVTLDPDRARGGEPAWAAAQVVALEPGAEGTRVHTRTRITDVSDCVLAVLDDVFLLRGADLPPLDHTVVPAVTPAAGIVERPRRTIGRVRVVAPLDPTVFAVVSGDHNPIHRAELVARVVGLDRRITHGIWTSATAQRVVEQVVPGAGIARWFAEFTGVVVPGDELEIVVTRRGVLAGALVVEVAASVVRDGERTLVLRAEATVRGPRTAYLFPGQGIQRPGMGLDAIERSAAARDVWRRADRHTRERLGFSILRVVRDNPSSLEVLGADGSRVLHRHPAGVLHLTQFTQVAMATLAMAQVAELREQGVFDERAIVAGHSVGEYNALAAIGDVLPLEVVLELVFRRGEAMHHLVPRDAEGRSGYRLAVVRPHQVALSHVEADDLVAAVGRRLGETLEIVNYNLKGKQYAVAGTVDALAALERELDRRRTPGSKDPLLYVPGIDVPFHSTVLRAGVDEFRAHLDAGLPERIDPDLLVGRYVPNLVPRLFSLERSYVREVADYVDSSRLHAVLEHWDDAVADPGRLCRTLLVELLAWQFASPVRWIETQDLLFAPDALGVEHVVEVGLGTAPTVANLASATVAADPALAGRVVVHNVERDRIAVFHLDEDEPVEDTTEPHDGDTDAHQGTAPGAPGAAPDAPPHAPAVHGADAPVVEDRPITHLDALRWVLAIGCKVRPDQLGDHDTIDELAAGVSSRRNQLLMDLGTEFGVSGVDGAHEVELTVLADELAARAGRYRFPGPVLGPALDSLLSAALGPRRLRPAELTDVLATRWGLGAGWAQRVAVTVALEGRAGQSARGGELGRLVADAPEDAHGVVAAALVLVAGELGVPVPEPVAAASPSTVDAVAVDALADRILGPSGVLATWATRLLDELDTTVPLGDVSTPPAPVVGELPETERLAVHRSNALRPSFDPARHVEFSSWWASARHDTVALDHESRRGELSAEELDRTAERLARLASDPVVAAVATRAAAAAHARGDAATRRRFDRIAAGAGSAAVPGRFAGEVALVTGAAPGSIAWAVAAGLLEGGATVVLTASSLGAERLAACRELYRIHAVPGSVLHVVPANLASFGDVDALIEWLITETVQSTGASSTLMKPPLFPTIVVPFAAGSVHGDLADVGPESELAVRVLVWSVERLIARVADAAQRVGTAGRPSTVIVPLSPNHGTFGGDGAYGEAKAALEVLEARWRSEHDTWGRHIRLVLPTIGWVRGTGLMAANDHLAPLVEAEGVRTFSAAEMAHELLRAVDEARHGGPEPQRVDLSGGLSALGSLRPILDVAPAAAPDATPAATPDERGGDTAATPPTERPAASAMIAARLSPPAIERVRTASALPPAPTLPLEELIVVVGVGEVGPWGTSATRFDLEVTAELSDRSVVELAWACGLVHFDTSGEGAWIDTATGDEVAEADLAATYRDEVERRCGIRVLDPDGPLDPDGLVHFVEVRPEHDVVLAVGTEDDARALAAADPQSCRVRPTPEGTWQVVRLAGAPIRVPRRVGLSRRVGAQVPTGFDPARWGIPSEMIAAVDRLSLWNLVATTEAFLDAGVEPEELLEAVHPSRVGSTQGSGMGGMSSLQRMYRDAVLGGDHANDLLQEGLANVVAAYVVQSFIGGYGPMVHPVAACATAAVSLEVAVDKIRSGRADVVVAGGFDDLALEGVLGFGEMSATADTDAMMAKGLEPQAFSRPNDRRRGGFVEAQGGGTLLVARGSVALALGLPVRGVVVFAQSTADGIHTSIPAPGMGALACATGGERSPLAVALADHGLGIDDVAVVSKHDTSTAANDPNESELHQRIATALGRHPGNPAVVVSQKAVTGHAKGGAAAWQAIGLLQILETGIIPGNPNLDCVSESHRDHGALVYGSRPIRAGSPLRAGLLTSLGFGHVSAVVCLAAAGTFLAAVRDQRGEEALVTYLERADRRRTDGAYRREAQLVGGPGAFRKRVDRRFAGGEQPERQREEEAAMLLDPGARLDRAGRYVVGPTVGPRVGAGIGSGASR